MTRAIPSDIESRTIITHLERNKVLVQIESGESNKSCKPENLRYHAVTPAPHSRLSSN
jgi:hypothetical protein